MPYPIGTSSSGTTSAIARKSRSTVATGIPLRIATAAIMQSTVERIGRPVARACRASDTATSQSASPATRTTSPRTTDARSAVAWRSDDAPTSSSNRTGSVHPADWERIAELVARYRDLPLGTVDASLVALAERLGETDVASFDRRDLTVVRPRHCEALTLRP